MLQYNILPFTVQILLAILSLAIIEGVGIQNTIKGEHFFMKKKTRKRKVFKKSNNIASNKLDDFISKTKKNKYFKSVLSR
jgi:hypothetical protein